MSIKYIKPVYSKTANGRTLEDKSTSGTNKFEDASKYKDVWNDFNEDKFPRALYETTEDRFTQELLNIEQKSGASDTKVEFEIPATVTPGKNPAVIASKLIKGYMSIYDEDETKPMATENKRTNTFFISQSYQGVGGTPKIDSIEVKPDVSGSITITVDGSDLPHAKMKCFARFDLEDDFLGDNLGEIELVMSDYMFQPRPTSIGVTWSQLAEITLDASFGLSAQDMLVTYAGDAIKINLDLRAFKLAYGIAKANKNYLVEFDANYQSAATIEGYFHTAQTFPSALDTVTDNMVNDLNRGGYSRLCCGASAGSYMKLVKGVFSDKGRQPAKGAYQFGEFGGVPAFKLPSSIIPTDEILTVYLPRRLCYMTQKLA